MFLHDLHLGQTLRKPTPNRIFNGRGSSLYEFRDTWFGPRVHILASCTLELNRVTPCAKYLKVLLLGEGAK